MNAVTEELEEELEGAVVCDDRNCLGRLQLNAWEAEALLCWYVVEVDC